jgi:predicted Fe-Mo cluster-binding NifX family protein
MKVAVSAAGRTLDAAVDPRFGRCSTFVLVETDTMSFEAIDNDSGSLGGGAGIKTAQWVAQKGVRAVLTGACGPNAHEALSAAGIDVIVGCSGTVARSVPGGLAPAGRRSQRRHPIRDGSSTTMTDLGRRPGLHVLRAASARGAAG